MANNKTILVTGGAGYIGAHVCKELKMAGYNPVAYDNLSTGFESFVKWGPFEKGDIVDSKRLTEVIKKHKPAGIVHMAAYISVGESVKLPGKYYQNNSFGGLCILEAMKECGVKNILFSSTAVVYGSPKKIPIDESEQTGPINPYGASKLMVEQFLRDFEVSDGIKHVVLRYFNAAGADSSGEIGCNHEVPGNLIPILMDLQSGKRKEFQIFGTDYPTPDGTAVRDYIHVTDLARAHVLAIGHLLDGKDSITLNLGTGKGHSVNEVVASAERITGKKVPYENVPRRAGDPSILVADSSLAKKILGWEVEYKDIDSIVKTAWHWQNKRVGK